MEEGKVTSAEPTCHRGRRTESAGQQRASSNRHVILPNPHLYQPRPRGNQSGAGGKESPPSNINGGDLAWRAKATTKNYDSRVQSSVVGYISADAQRTGFGEYRSAKTPKPPQAHLAQFEVKMSDFPQLDASTPHAHRESWGPKVTADRHQPSKSTPPWEDVHHQTSMRGSPTVAEARQIDQHILTSPANQPTVSSWANVASQPPKKNFQREKNVSLSEEKAAHQPDEGTAVGRKKRKKKKKGKEADDGTEAELEHSTVQQEPPKFEDEEEFPGLAPAQTWSDRTASSRNTGKGDDAESQHDEMVPTKGKNAAKMPPSETATIGQKVEKPSSKKSKAPVQLDIGNMLSALENKQKSQKIKQNVISVGGGLPIIHKQMMGQKKVPWQQEKIAHNPLDSTSPLVKKGKQREVPKAKKPTALKKVILKEREERKQRRLLEERGILPENDSTVATGTAEDEQCDSNLTEQDIDAVSVSDEQKATEMAKGDDRESGLVQADEQRSIQQDFSVTVPDRPKIHSRKFREYCSQMLSKDVDQCVTSLLKELVRFQDRLYQKDPMKARMKRRVVMGLREVLKHLKLHKVKCVIISPNCERVQAKGGLDEALHKIIDTCREQEVPFVFALSRKALGRCVNKMVPVSLVGIFNYDGAQDYYHQMIELSSEARRAYEEMLASVEQAVRVECGNGDISEEHSAARLMEPEQSEPESQEPGYTQLWRKLLENESSYNSLNFDAWPSECNDENQEEKS